MEISSPEIPECLISQLLYITHQTHPAEAMWPTAKWHHRCGGAKRHQSKVMSSEGLMKHAETQQAMPTPTNLLPREHWVYPRGNIHSITFATVISLGQQRWFCSIRDDLILVLMLMPGTSGEQPTQPFLNSHLFKYHSPAFLPHWGFTWAYKQYTLKQRRTTQTLLLTPYKLNKDALGW